MYGNLFLKDLLQKGLQILLGAGKDTIIWNDMWLPTHPPRPPQPNEEKSQNFGLVSDLMNVYHNQRDHQKLETTIWIKDIPIIQGIRISSQLTLDLLEWGYTDYGLYTMKSGYWLATHIQDQTQTITAPRDYWNSKNKCGN